MQNVKGETDHCRDRLMKYCQGQGIDLGCGSTRIRTDTIGIDLYNPQADMKADARDLNDFPDDHFDYVYSSHLLEEIENTEATLKEWLRILKKGGYLVLYQADEELYYSFDDPLCNKAHKHHFSWESLWKIFENIGDTELIHHGRHIELGEWSFELVVRKCGSDNTTEKDLNMGISILVPTFNRPQSIENFSKSLNDTVKNPENIEIAFGVHDDDKMSINKIKEIAPALKIDIRAVSIKRHKDGQTHLSYLWNQIYDQAKYPILGYFGDDVLFKTPGWDEEVRSEFKKDPYVMVACNDVHVQRGKYATLYFTHRFVHERIGFYLHPEFRRWYADTFWDNVYKRAGKMIYREDIVTEHLHPDKFPERTDEVYKKMDKFKDEDRARWVSNNIKNLVFSASEQLENFSRNKKIISFSLWGSDPRYLVGAVKNAQLRKNIYPGWICRYYVDPRVPADTLKELYSLGAEIVPREISDHYKGLFWRFEPACEEDVSEFLVRDCDSRINPREAEAVAEWEASNKVFHTMRDHPYHDIPLLGALWGAKKGFLPEFCDLMKKFLNELDSDQIAKRDKYFYTDQNFLKQIWTKVKDNAMVHDDNPNRFDDNAKPFKIKLDKDLFVGQQWDKNNQPLKVPI